MIEKIVVEWTFEPKDYFEDDITIDFGNYKIDIVPGAASASIPPQYIDNIEEIISALNQDLVSRFLAVQVMTHQKYSLSEPSRYDLKKDGSKNIYLQAHDIVCVASVSGDIVVRDADGNVVSDTKKERIDKKKWFSETSAKFRAKDHTLNQMLKSYGASVSDPTNELVHLYEIRDAASKKFGGEKNARSMLGVTKKEWSDFGLVANKKPLVQGRHRGNNVGELRQAETSELATVRKIASKIVENYLIILEKND
ncbi:putative ferric uptake regulation protein [Desulforapulum autotrophicum HRM2]|uniref:Ferric uptake regulation protein n=1 Tax=Desulforapulum autotrophicum (strain ATCC 43914 / DSM 3382 / VKM B-1955 / HRM2) TaxID=177437 RepID=C0QGM9_DESAH|nr:hypothetical protein [Desulforapulum autotrophicum]ACN13504.1 putative ferric uptake regulation protein [Desulforapulum autotrophicum HRM2]